MKHFKVRRRVCSDSEPCHSENHLLVRRAELDFVSYTHKTERCTVCNHHNEIGGRSLGL